MKMLLCELEMVDETQQQPMPIYFDSKSAITMGNSYKDTKHTRHIMRRYHYVRECIASNHFEMKWISTEFQIADIGTKQTPGPRHKFLMELLHVKITDSKSLVQEG
jgi:hypothetical protein